LLSDRIFCGEPVSTSPENALAHCDAEPRSGSGEFMKKRIAGASVLAAAFIAATTSLAQERMQAGSLTCDVSAGIGLILGSHRQI
jgi:hypothetical protein